MSILNSQLNLSNLFNVQQLGGTEVSGVQTGSNSAVAVGGLNIGVPASGLTVNFIIPSGEANAPTRYYEFAKFGPSTGIVLFSGAAGVTIDGGTAAITVVKGTGLTAYSPSGVNTYFVY